MEKQTERYIWKNTFTGHWMLSSSPRPVDGHAGSATLRQGFRSWRAAMEEAGRQIGPIRARWAAIAARKTASAPEIGEWVEGYDERDETWCAGKLAFHLDENRSVIEQPVRGDSRVYQVDVRRDSLRPGLG